MLREHDAFWKYRYRIRSVHYNLLRRALDNSAHQTRNRCPQKSAFENLFATHVNYTTT